MILIVTNTTKAYHDYIASRKGVYRHVKSVNDLRGLTGLTAYLVGDYKSLPDWLDIQSYLNYGQFRVNGG